MNSYWFLLLCMSTLPPLEPTSSLLCVKNDPHTDFFLAMFFLLVGFKQSCFPSEDVLLPSVVKNQGKREHCLQSAHSQTLTLTPLHPPCRHRKVSVLFQQQRAHSWAPGCMQQQHCTQTQQQGTRSLRNALSTSAKKLSPCIKGGSGLLLKAISPRGYLNRSKLCTE